VTPARVDDLDRIRRALDAARALVAASPGPPALIERKVGGDPVTAADRAINDVLRAILPCPGDGWLSEESPDNLARLASRRVWVVDPLDGTREYVRGLPEWCISIGLIEDGQPIAGGVCNPAAGQMIIGALGLGITVNGAAAGPRLTYDLSNAEILASRSEFERGEWRPFLGGPFRVRPCGSVAYKLALVAAGCCDATWTLVPKHYWDVAGGVALVRAVGAEVWVPSGDELALNRPNPRLPGLAAATPGIADAVRRLLKERRSFS